MEEIKKFLDSSVTAFHAVKNCKAILEKNGYQELKENELWKLEGDKYYVTRNDSSIIAFTLNKLSEYSFNIVESHTDSPTFKLKSNSDVVNHGYNQLSVEAYGGLIYGTMFDRPLSVAGRVITKEKDRIVSNIVDFKRDLCFIPNLAIHMDAKANSDKSYNVQNNCFPILAMEQKDFHFHELIEKEFNLTDVLSYDMFLYNRTAARTVGVNNEFLMSARIDNLLSVYASLQGFISNDNKKSINLFCAFDNEECGSMTKQGAFSTFLKDILARINSTLGKSKEELLVALNKSFVISADNAHAFHPNYASVSDVNNMCIINKGIAIKAQSNFSYTTDALSQACIKEVFKKANLAYQVFMNRSDMRGGGTLGKLSSVQVSVNSVDIGIPQLAMHSSYEVCGVKDISDYIKLFKTFYSLHFSKAGNYIIM